MNKKKWRFVIEDALTMGWLIPFALVWDKNIRGIVILSVGFGWIREDDK